MKPFATNLRNKRKQRRMSQIELARIAGLQQSHVGHYEAGRRSPSALNLISLATALGCSTDYLLGRSADSEWDAGYRAGIMAARAAIDQVAGQKR